MDEVQFMKQAQTAFASIVDAFKLEASSIRGNRPTVDLVEHIPVTAYDNQQFTVQQLGSIGVVPPSELTITVWDSEVVNAVAKAIEDAHVGLSVSHDGTVIRARLSALGAERRDELVKTVKKLHEQSRIAVRTQREDFMKKVKMAEATEGLSEDRSFKLKERLQKVVDDANAALETVLDKKIVELAE